MQLAIGTVFARSECKIAQRPDLRPDGKAQPVLTPAGAARISVFIARGNWRKEMDPLDVSLSEMQNVIDEGGWTVQAGGGRFRAGSPSVSLVSVPVRRPSVRGGVYFAQKQAYRISCSIETDDLSPLTSCMLGPNRDFEPVHVYRPGINIAANLVGYVESGRAVKLNLIVTEMRRDKPTG